MNIDAVRRFCLCFAGAKENLQWEDDLCFKVGGKIFAILAVDSVPPQLCFKCTPEKFTELVEHPEIIPAPYLGRYKWVLLQRLDGLRTAEIEDLIRESYAMVRAKVPKRRTRRVEKKPRNRR